MGDQPEQDETDFLADYYTGGESMHGKTELNSYNPLADE